MCQLEYFKLMCESAKEQPMITQIAKKIFKEAHEKLVDELFISI